MSRHATEQPDAALGTSYAGAATERVSASTGIGYTYRDLGSGDEPLVLLQHFRGNLDNWDPALIDALAAERRVITFNNVGVASTSGSMITCRGWWNAPIRFLPSGWFTPTLPPIALSTCASNVVGT